MYRKRFWSGLFTLVVALLSSTVAVGRAPVTLAMTPAQSTSATYPFFESQAIEKAVGYLRTQQVASGGINSFGGGADPGGTSRLVMSLNAVGYPATVLVSSDNRTLTDYLAAEVVGYIYKDDTRATENLFPGRAGLVLGAVSAAGLNPRNFGGVDLIAELEGVYRADGTYSTDAVEGFASGRASEINQTLAILGLVSAGRPIPQAATQWLIDRQRESGGFNPAANNILATQQSIPALLGAFYPYRTSGTLASNFTPIKRGPNPDRLVTAPIIIEINPQRTQATVIASLGSDLNANGSATIEWDVLRNSAGAAAFQSVPATREPGAFRATINLSGVTVGPLDTLRVRATFSDPDGVQDGGRLTTEPVAVIGDLAPQRRYLPIVGR